MHILIMIINAGWYLHACIHTCIRECLVLLRIINMPHIHTHACVPKIRNNMHAYLKSETKRLILNRYSNLLQYIHACMHAYILSITLIIYIYPTYTHMHAYLESETKRLMLNRYVLQCTY
jgi:hypothetical protein